MQIDLDRIPKDTLIYKYLNVLHINDADLDKNTGNVFLSVIVRTQGKRNQLLVENLKSLEKQTDQNFEVILLCHNLSSDEEKNIHTIINDYTEAFIRKIRIVSSKAKGRTALLNEGFELADGEYIVCLDDDDIAYPIWVEEFHKAAETNRGKILHAYIDDQNWKLNEADEAIPNGGIDKIFYKDFDFARQLFVNYCPFNGLAFPKFAFYYLGLRFDEELDTQEDWDYLMRVEAYTGVHDIKKATALYRHFECDNSKIIEADDKWKTNRETFLNKLNSLYYPMKIETIRNLKTNICYEIANKITLKQALKVLFILLKKKINNY